MKGHRGRFGGAYVSSEKSSTLEAAIETSLHYEIQDLDPFFRQEMDHIHINSCMNEKESFKNNNSHCSSIIYQLARFWTIT